MVATTAGSKSSSAKYGHFSAAWIVIGPSRREKFKLGNEFIAIIEMETGTISLASNSFFFFPDLGIYLDSPVIPLI